MTPIESPVRASEPEANSIPAFDSESREEFDHSGDYDAGESFEIAAPAGGETFRQLTADTAAETGPAPALEDLVTRIPAETKQALEELLRARFTTVRRIDPDRLR